MLKRLVLNILEDLIRNISGSLGRKIRYLYYKRRLGGCGKGVIIDIGVTIQSPKDVFIGDKVWLDQYVVILAGKPSGERTLKVKNNEEFAHQLGELHIGNEVHIAPFVVIQAHGGVEIGEKSGVASGAKIYSLSHHYRNLLDKTDKRTYYFTPMTSQENQSLIASPVVIGSGTAISLNNIILPGTIIPANTWLGVGMTGFGNSYNENYVYSVSQTIEEKSR